MTLNRIPGVVISLAGILLLLWIIPHHTEQADYGWVKPATLPNLSAMIILISGIVQIIFPEGKCTEFDVAIFLRLCMFFSIASAGLFLMDNFGFTFTSPALVALFMIMVGERRPLWLFSGILILPASIWFVVVFLLNWPLP